MRTRSIVFFSIVFYSISPFHGLDGFGHQGAASEHDSFLTSNQTGCWFNRSSHHIRLKSRGPEASSGGKRAVHKFMKTIYLRMKLADEEEENLGVLGDNADQLVKGYSPVSQFQKLNGKEVYALFNTSGLESDPLQPSNTSVQIVLYRTPALWRWGQDRRLELVLRLNNGHKSKTVSASILSMNDAGSGRILADISSYWKEILSTRTCGLLKISFQLFLIKRKRRRELLRVEDFFRFQSPNSGVLLVVYNNIKPSFLHELMHIEDSQLLMNLYRNEMSRREKRSADTKEAKDCSVRQYSFPFSEIGWVSEWFIYPVNYQLNYCAGHCPSPLVPTRFRASVYAFLKNEYLDKKQGQDTELPHTCCTPNDYYRMTILFYNSNYDSYDAKNMANMIVKSCQCV